MTSAWGIRSLTDTFMNYFQPGVPTFLRVKNVSVDQPLAGSGADYAALGFQPEVAGPEPSGTTDFPVRPSAEVLPASMHSIGISKGLLTFGAKVFSISHTFVLNRMSVMGYTDYWQVWRDPSVLGFYHDGRLFAIVNISHRDIAGEPVMWTLVCNSLENASPAGAEPNAG